MDRNRYLITMKKSFTQVVQQVIRDSSSVVYNRRVYNMWLVNLKLVFTGSKEYQTFKQCRSEYIWAKGGRVRRVQKSRA